MRRIGIVTASTRPARTGHHVAAWVTGLAPDDVDLVGVDLREEASEQDVRDMVAALVAVPTASVAAGERR